VEGTECPNCKREIAASDLQEHITGIRGIIRRLTTRLSKIFPADLATLAVDHSRDDEFIMMLHKRGYLLLITYLEGLGGWQSRRPFSYQEQDCIVIPIFSSESRVKEFESAIKNTQLSLGGWPLTPKVFMPADNDIDGLLQIALATCKDGSYFCFNKDLYDDRFHPDNVHLTDILDRKTPLHNADSTRYLYYSRSKESMLFAFAHHRYVDGIICKVVMNPKSFFQREFSDADVEKFRELQANLRAAQKT
jgi:hypothetical protein